MRLIDRYIGLKSLRYYAMILSIATALLLFENAPRVLEAASRLSNPMIASLFILLGFLPEYLTLAGLFGIFFTGALLAYREQRRGELVAWTAMGLSYWRITAAFAALALANAGMLLAMTGWLQPYGERLVAEVDSDIATGLYGMALHTGEPADLGTGRTIMFQAVDPERGLLKGVLLREPIRAISAASAHVSSVGANTLKLDFEDGVVLEEDAKGQPRAVAFHKLAALVAGQAGLPGSGQLPFQRVASLGELTQMATDQGATRSHRSSARAEIVYRLLLPLLSLAFAVMGFSLGIPSRATGSMVAVVCGAGAVILFLRLADLTRHKQESHAVSWGLALAVLAFSLCYVVAWLNHRFEPGYLDKVFANRLSALRRLLRMDKIHF